MAATYSRASLPLGALNIHYGIDDSLIPREKLPEYSLAALERRRAIASKMDATYRKLCELFGGQLDPEVAARFFRSYGDKAIGVCQHYAYLTCEFLCKHLPADITYDIVGLTYPGMHIFNVINPPEKMHMGFYPKDFSEWPKETIVVDGWVDIVCFIRDYGDVWNSKMRDLEKEGIKIYENSPLKYLNAVSQNEKISCLHWEEITRAPSKCITISSSVLNKYFDPKFDLPLD